MDNLENKEEYIDIKAYLSILIKWKYLIMGIVLLAVITSGILSFFVLSPVYESKTVIMVKQYQDPKVAQKQNEQDDLQAVVDSLARLPQMTIKSYVGQITNEALLRKVIEDLKLDKMVYTPDALENIISANNVPDTNLIEIYVKNNDRVLATKIANTLAEEFLNFIGSTNESQLVQSSEFLIKELNQKDKELTEASKTLNKERNQARNVAYLEQEAENKNNNLSAYQNQLIQAESDYQKSLAGKAVVEQNLKTVPEKIKEKKMDIETGEVVETETTNPTYLEITQMEVQKSVEISELDAQRNNLKNAINQIQTELKTLQTELNNKKEKEEMLQEKADQAKQTRDVLAEKLTQVQIAKSVNLGQNSLQIVTPAFPEGNPVSPRKMLNIAVAFFLGLLISVGAAFLLELLDNTVNKAEDIEKHLGLPILGMIPKIRKEEFEVKG